MLWGIIADIVMSCMIASERHCILPEQCYYAARCVDTACTATSHMSYGDGDNVPSTVTLLLRCFHTACEHALDAETSSNGLSQSQQS